MLITTMELSSLIGSERIVSYRDRKQMPFCEAVLLETLRLANILPQAMPHFLEKELTIDGQVNVQHTVKLLILLAGKITAFASKILIERKILTFLNQVHLINRLDFLPT